MFRMIFSLVKVMLTTFIAVTLQCQAFATPSNESSASLEEMEELDLTWLKGALMLPIDLSEQLGIKTGVITRVDKVIQKLPALNSKEPMPLAILAHGCFGIGGEQVEQAKLLSARGYVVFMPSYYGRKKSFQICGGNSAGEIKFENLSVAYLKQRREEVDYALSKARSFPFVSKERTLVSGHSMGGATVGSMTRADITAYVITGWGCHNGYSSRPPKSVSLLSMRFKDDPWLKDSAQCDAGFLTGREKDNTVSIVLDGQRTHEVIHDPRAVAAYLEFVGRVVGFPELGTSK